MIILVIIIIIGDDYLHPIVSYYHTALGGGSDVCFLSSFPQEFEEVNFTYVSLYLHFCVLCILLVCCVRKLQDKINLKTLSALGCVI